MRLVWHPVVRAGVDHPPARGEHGSHRVEVLIERMHVLEDVDRENQVELAVHSKFELVGGEWLDRRHAHPLGEQRPHRGEPDRISFDERLRMRNQIRALLL